MKAKTKEQIVEEIRLKIEKYANRKMTIDEQGEWFEFLMDTIDDLYDTVTKDILEMTRTIEFVKLPKLKKR